VVKDGKAYAYAKWCVEEQEGKVPHYVKMQARKWIDIADGKHAEAYVDEKAYDKICRLLKIMVHPDLHCSIMEGLEPYAWLFITASLCTMCREDSKYYEKANANFENTKIRFYTTALLEIARKNFKTFNSAVIFILLMLTEPDFSRFFSVAPDLLLSSELKNAIRKIIKVSPALYDEEEPAFKILRSQIICNLNENEYTPLAYSQDRMDGKLANAFLADEAGAMDDYPVEAMRSSQVTILNKLGIVISTQYPNDNNVMISEIDYGKKVLDDLLEDERYFSLLYEPDDDLKQGENWQKDDRVLYQTNPVSVDHEYIFDDLVKKRSIAILYENKRENFLCKHCNIQYKGLGIEGYVDIQKVKECRIENNPEFWKGRDVWLGLDLSMTDDNTATAMATMVDDILYAKVFCFIPGDEARIKQKTTKEKLDYREMIRNEYCYPCGEEVIDYGYIEKFIIELPKKYGVNLRQVGYDRYNAISTVQKLEAEGIECVEIKQHSSVLHPPTKLLKEKILLKQFRYESNRLLEINFQNARCTEDTNLNKYVNKKKSSGKVDMVVALINAVYLVQQENLYGNNFVVQF
jgi:phage terminase large subunit-like protein